MSVPPHIPIPGISAPSAALPGGRDAAEAPGAQPSVAPLRITLHSAGLGGENPQPIFRAGPDDTPVVALLGLAPEVARDIGRGCARRVLPYRLQDRYDRAVRDQEFAGVTLDNGLLKAVFLPEMGGRLISLFDRGAGRELLFHNPVLQPANLALRDAWFAGGIEWNIGRFGHAHHTCSPVFAARCLEGTIESVIYRARWYRQAGGLILGSPFSRLRPAGGGGSTPRVDPIRGMGLRAGAGRCTVAPMAPPHRYPLIFNPQARSQRGRRTLGFVMKHAGELALYATNRSGEARELAARFAAGGEPVVIAAGGDGTINEVVRGLAGTDTALAVLPAGTMNVFSREIGLPQNDLARCFRLIKDGHIREIDLFEANGTPFVQMAGIGIDAKIIEDTTWESKKALGPLAYLLTAIKVLGERPLMLEVMCDDGRRETGVAVLVGNGALYGGGFRVFHLADNRDSQLDVLVFKETGFQMVLDSVWGLANGGFDSVANATYLRAATFAVTADIPVPVEVDGELLGRFAITRFAPAASRLRVIAPRETGVARPTVADSSQSARGGVARP